MKQGGKCMNILKNHAHWVNHLSLSSDYAVRVGAFDHAGMKTATPQEPQTKALAYYEKVVKKNGTLEELMVTASDDFTMFLWNPIKQTKTFSKNDRPSDTC